MRLELKNRESCRFTSKELDEETGLYYYGARYYEPTSSRWMSADPAGFELINPMERDEENGWKNKESYSVIEGANWYSYVSNNPVKYVDPTGEETHIFSIPVLGKHRHLFIAIRDAKGNIQVRSLYPKNLFLGFLSWVFPEKGQSIPELHNETTKKGREEWELAESFLEDGTLSEGLRHEGVIPVPPGMTEEELDQAILEEADNYRVENRPYSAKEGYNSNTYIDDSVEGGGGVMPDVEGATQQNYGEAPPDEDR